MTVIWLLIAMASNQAAASDTKVPEQAARGQAIFFDENAAMHCGSCHALAGKGAAVGPGISRLARLHPHAIATAVRATLTEHVQTIKVKGGGEFPGMPAANDSGTLQYYDLSSKPPVLRRFEQKDLVYARDNATWKHPPSATGLTNQQLADVIAYIKWASYGDTKGVKADDIE